MLTCDAMQPSAAGDVAALRKELERQSATLKSLEEADAKFDAKQVGSVCLLRCPGCWPGQESFLEGLRVMLGRGEGVGRQV